MMKNKRVNKIAIILIVSLIFISCLEVETTININKDRTGTWFLTYRLQQETSFITPGDELGKYNYFPLNELEIIDRIDSIDGLEMNSITSNSTILFTEFLVEMNFTDINYIQLFFNNFTDIPLIDISLADEETFTLKINNPFPEAVSSDSLNLISGLYSDNTMGITILLPGLVTKSSQGLLSENTSEAKIEIKIIDTFQLTESFEWIINYE